MNQFLLARVLSGPAPAFSDRALLQHMLDFEAALAQAQADCGLLPAEAAAAIARCCRAEDFDIDALVLSGTRAGSLAIPLVQALTQAVGGAGARWVHFGSTSQDVLDTAMVLATRDAWNALAPLLDGLIDGLLALAEQHADTPMLARTLMQPAQLTSFGLKCARWAAPLRRARSRLAEQAARSLQLQLGGAVGTLAAMGSQGTAVRAALARRLGLADPGACWHTQRDEWLRLALEVALLSGSLGKIATDLALLGQAEIAEVTEAPEAGRGGSSAMPNKRNPVGAMLALAAAKRMPAQAASLLNCMDAQHERGLGNWQAELAEWPSLWIGAHSAVKALAHAVQGLRVDTARMRANIDAQYGLVFAEAAAQLLAPVLGKAEAHTLVQTLSLRAIAERRPLAELCSEALATQIRPEALSQAFSIEHALAPARQQLATEMTHAL